MPKGSAPDSRRCGRRSPSAPVNAWLWIPIGGGTVSALALQDRNLTMKHSPRLVISSVILVALIAICSSEVGAQSGTDKGKSGKASPSVSAREARRSRWLNGTWTGTGFQPEAPDNKEWTIRLEYAAAARKESIEYPSLRCKGYWTLRQADGRKAEFIEHLTDGKERCQDGSSVVVTKIDDRFVSIAFFVPSVQKGVVAYSVLEKQLKK
jgi:hypothetical protein